LHQFHHVSMQLQQEPPPDLGLVRELFHLLVGKFPVVASNIRLEVTIIHPPIFDVAILKSLKSDTLNDEEELSFRMFELVADVELIENSEMSITERLISVRLRDSVS
jgi:hypothetical protein